MHRKAHPIGGYVVANRIAAAGDEQDRTDASGPSYVESVLFGRKRAHASAGLPEQGPFKPHQRPHLPAEGELAPQARRKGTEPCAS